MPHKLLFGLAAAQTGTQNFNTAGTFSWTAPTGVTSVTVTGRGGSNDTTWSSATAYFYLTQGPYTDIGSSTGYTSLGSSLTYESIKSQAATNLAQFSNVTTDAVGENVTADYHSYYYFTGEGWFRRTQTHNRTYRRTGTVASAGNLFSNSGTVPTDGSALFSAGSYATNLEAEILVSGGSSSAIGQTFSAGGDEQTFTDVSVTPGQSYSIVVGANEGSNVSFIRLNW